MHLRLAGLCVGMLVTAGLAAPLVRAGDEEALLSPYRLDVRTDGTLNSRLSRSPADLVVYVGSEQRGSLETCGCPHRPRGSLARLVAYVTASRAASDAPSILVNPGRWLEDPGGYAGEPDPAAVARDGWMVRGLASTGWDALNVTPADAAGLAALDPGLLRSLPLVSANVEGPGVSRWRILEKGGRRIGITGVAADEPTAAPIPGFRVHPPARARAVVQELAEQVDFVVLLQWRASETAKAISESLSRPSLVVDANDHSGQTPPFLVGRALWVWADFDALRVGEVRLRLEGDRILSAEDRHIDLDPLIPDDRAVAALLKRAREDMNGGAEAGGTSRYASPLPPFPTSEGATYLGNAACNACHPAEAAVWKGTSHAHALATLAGRESEHNPLCVGCHVTGYSRGGWDGTATLANVGCEACHGPGSTHVAAPGPGYGHLPRDASACAACHTAETTPDFAFDAWWAQVAHGAVAQPESPR